MLVNVSHNEHAGQDLFYIGILIIAIDLSRSALKSWRCRFGVLRLFRNYANAF